MSAARVLIRTQFISGIESIFLFVYLHIKRLRNNFPTQIPSFTQISWNRRPKTIMNYYLQTCTARTNRCRQPCQEKSVQRQIFSWAPKQRSIQQHIHCVSKNVIYIYLITCNTTAWSTRHVVSMYQHKTKCPFPKPLSVCYGNKEKNMRSDC